MEAIMPHEAIAHGPVMAALEVAMISVGSIREAGAVEQTPINAPQTSSPARPAKSKWRTAYGERCPRHQSSRQSRHPGYQLCE
jgi:hypothetical protein